MRSYLVYLGAHDTNFPNKNETCYNRQACVFTSGNRGSAKRWASRRGPSATPPPRTPAAQPGAQQEFMGKLSRQAARTDGAGNGMEWDGDGDGGGWNGMGQG